MELRAVQVFKQQKNNFSLIQLTPDVVDIILSRWIFILQEIWLMNCFQNWLYNLLNSKNKFIINSNFFFQNKILKFTFEWKEIEWKYVKVVIFYCNWLHLNK